MKTLFFYILVGVGTPLVVLESLLFNPAKVKVQVVLFWEMMEKIKHLRKAGKK